MASFSKVSIMRAILLSLLLLLVPGVSTLSILSKLETSGVFTDQLASDMSAFAKISGTFIVIYTTKNIWNDGLNGLANENIKEELKKLIEKDSEVDSSSRTYKHKIILSFVKTLEEIPPFPSIASIDFKKEGRAESLKKLRDSNEKVQNPIM